MALPNDPNCIFCKIVAGKIPSHKIYEDDAVFVFMDINPIVESHVLVVPKPHSTTVMDTEPAVLAEIGKRLPKLCRAVLRVSGKKACHVLINNGEEASQSVGHLHVHILPRREGDGYRLNWPSQKLDAATGAATAQSIAEALASGV